MSSTPKKYRFHSVFLFFRRRSALTFLFRHPKFLLNFFKKLLTNYFSHSMISNVSGRQIQNNLHMREWLSWWSTTLPRSGPRVRVPSRALCKIQYNFIYARVAQLVEHDLAKVGAAGSSPVSRSFVENRKP